MAIRPIDTRRTQQTDRLRRLHNITWTNNRHYCPSILRIHLASLPLSLPPVITNPAIQTVFRAKLFTRDNLVSAQNFYSLEFCSSHLSYHSQQLRRTWRERKRAGNTCKRIASFANRIYNRMMVQITRTCASLSLVNVINVEEFPLSVSITPSHNGSAFSYNTRCTTRPEHNCCGWLFTIAYRNFMIELRPTTDGSLFVRFFFCFRCKNKKWKTFHRCINYQQISSERRRMQVARY